MKERPILFKAEMVKAILEGRKTMTRRVMKTQPHCQEEVQAGFFKSPYGQPGDRLWVRESFGYHADEEKYVERPFILYQADRQALPHVNKWRPSIHMPRWASRILLEITEVRVQLLQHISETEAWKEGVMANGTSRHAHEGQDLFRELWNSINAARGIGWDMNPWVWVVSFRRVE